MLLCDIGNTSLHFFDGEKRFKEDVHSFDPQTLQEDVFYICVNPSFEHKISSLPNWRDLSLHVNKERYYDTMGIDRIFACEAIENGVVVDAGSAITVDVMQNGVYRGGFIYPGVRAMQRCYANISPKLGYSFNFELNLGKIPKNSQDAISYGYLKPFYDEVCSYGLDIYLTGGDAHLMKKIFKDAIVDETLLFSSMQKIIKKADLC